MKPKINDSRRFKLEKVLRKGEIPFLSGRPQRREVINQNDILNLRIALNTEESLEAFLKQV
jgi:hypothetical protein